MSYIDLETVNQPRTYKNVDENLQIEVLEEVCTKLSDLSIENDRTEKIEKVRRHDTVFIDGERGTGKTALLLNIESFYRQKNNNPRLYFIGPIDPTLLYDNEDFLGVIFGSIVEEVEYYRRNYNYNEDNKNINNYYSALDKVSESLGAVMKLRNAKELSGGIEAIAANASSKALEQHTHIFFKKAAEFLGAKALVLLIDDVDMAFKKGFDVLEVVRKFLASPYIIPIVSGDGRLYKKLLCNQFSRDITCEEKECDNNDPIVDDIVNQYFNKVMPNDNRYTISPINNVKPDIYIGNEKIVSFEVLNHLMDELVNYYIHRKEEKLSVFPKENVRSFVQLAAKLKPVINKIKDFRSDNEPFFEYCLSENDYYKKFLDGIEEFYRYSTQKDKYLLSILSKNDISALFNDGNRLIIDGYQAFRGKFFKQDAHHLRFQCREKNNSEMISLPIEEVVEGVYLRKPDASEGEKDEAGVVDRFIASLFTHSLKHSQALTTRRYIFVGKFVTFLLLSLSHKDKESRIDEVMDILIQPPYGIKYDEDGIDADDIEDETTDFSITKEDLYREEILKMIKYSTFNSKALSVNSYTIYLILQKFYKDWIDLKRNYIAYTYDMTRDFGKSKELFQRIVWIFLNSVGYYETKTQATKVQIAMTHKVFNNKYIKGSEAYRYNLQWAIDNPSQESLLGFFYMHPIIQTILESSKDNSLNVMFPYMVSRKFSYAIAKNIRTRIQKYLSGLRAQYNIRKGIDIDKNQDNIKGFLESIIEKIRKSNPYEYDSIKERFDSKKQMIEYKLCQSIEKSNIGDLIDLCRNIKKLLSL